MNLKSTLWSVLFCSMFLNAVNTKIVKRSYPLKSAMGYLVAMAVPIDLENRNVFLSYNFEANYGLPSQPMQIIPDWLGEQKIIQKRSLINRKSLYKMIKDKLRLHGYPGKNCLLRMICDLSQNPLHEHNGLIGDLIQILLSPSLSMKENISKDYHVSEKRGKVKEGCVVYHDKCPDNVLDLISELDI